MLFLTLVFQSEFVIPRRTPDIARVVIAGNVIRVFGIVLSVGNVRAVRVTAVEHHRDFSAIKQRGVEAVGIPGIRFCQTQPEVGISLFGAVTVKIEPDAIPPLIVEVSIGVMLFIAFHPGRQGARHHRAVQQHRAEADRFAVRNARKAQLKSFVTCT
ncbi:hypothetical protein D3C80_1105790 [compost metagenome]